MVDRLALGREVPVAEEPAEIEDPHPLGLHQALRQFLPDGAPDDLQHVIEVSPDVRRGKRLQVGEEPSYGTRAPLEHVDGAELHPLQQFLLRPKLGGGEDLDLDLVLGPFGHEVGELLQSGLHDVRRGLHVAQLDHDRLLGARRARICEADHENRKYPPRDHSTCHDSPSSLWVRVRTGFRHCPGLRAALSAKAAAMVMARTIMECLATPFHAMSYAVP